MARRKTTIEKRTVSFRVEVELADWLDDYTKNCTWAQVRKGAPGGEHGDRDTGKSAFLNNLIHWVRESQVKLLPSSPNPFPLETPMQLDITQNGQKLRHIHHEGQHFIEAPASGEYEIVLCNNSPSRRLAVLSVDGINVVDGKDAGFGGQGYVLEPWQTTTVNGFLRSNQECARFTFSASEGSYAAQTGRGTSNTGVIGVAIFDEKPAVRYVPPVVKTIVEEHHHHHYPQPVQHPWPLQPPIWGTSSQGTTHRGDDHDRGMVFGSSASASVQPQGAGAVMDSMILEEPEVHVVPAGAQTKGVKRAPAVKRRAARGATASKSTEAEVKTSGTLSSDAPNLGTTYGKAETFHTQQTHFNRSDHPVLVLSFRYAVREKLKEWGVPVDSVSVAPPAPNPFPANPAAPGFVQPPTGWRG